MAVELTIQDYVATITLNAPESLNALVIDDLQTLRGMLRDCQSSDEVRVIILTGQGERAFCTGANLKATLPPTQGFSENFLKGRDAEAKSGGYTRLLDLSDLEIWKPMIAAVNGYCLGGGMELALQCDLRIASENASFALPEAKVASVPAVGGVQYLLRAIPAAHAMKLALTGDRINASEALKLGLVSDVVSLSHLHVFATEIARRICANGPLAVQVIKKLAVETAHLAPRDFVQQSNLQWGLLRDTADRIEGRKSFAEKRAAEYKGR